MNKRLNSGALTLTTLIIIVLAVTALVAPSAKAVGSEYQVAGARAMIQGPASRTLSNTTCRSIQRVFTSGSAIRVRLSNATATQAVTFNAVYAGIRTGGAATASNVQVFFGGSASVTLSPGQEVTSDPFTLVISINQDLAVSLYMSGSINSVTEGWPDDITTSTYCAAFSGGGNHAADTSGAAFTNALAQEMYWLTAVDIATDTPYGAVVAIGDSITAGTANMGRDGYNRWTEVLNARLAASSNPKPVANVAISGDTCQVANNWALPILDRLQRDVLNQSYVSHVIVLIGTNDIAKGVTSAALITCVQNIIGQVRAHGAKALVGTVIPWNANSTPRLEFNTWVRNNASTAFDGMVDFDAAVRDPNNINNILPAYDSGDHLHPNAAGHQAMGNAVDLALLNSLPGPTPVPPSDTGWVSPAANAPATGGDGNGFEGNPTNAYGDNAIFATDASSGANTNTVCNDPGKDRHIFYAYPLASVPGNATIQGIQVQLQIKVSSTSGSPKSCIELSWDGGTSWTAPQSSPSLTTSEASYLLGGATDTWGHTWTTAELNNLRVRITNVVPNTSRTFSLDWIPVRVYYIVSGPTATPTKTPTAGPSPTPTHTVVPPTPTNTPTLTPTATPAPPGSNLALNKPVTVSSTVSGNPGSYAVDGSLTTYWRSQSNLPAEWIVVDLGGATNVSQVKTTYDSLRRPTAYTLEVSTDNVNWTMVYSTTTGSGATETINFTPISARYVKMNTTAWANNKDHLRLVEFEIYP